MAVSKKLMTADELLRLPRGLGECHELIRRLGIVESDDDAQRALS